MIALLTIAFIISGPLFANNDLASVVKLEQSISGTHDFNFFSDGKTFPMNQVIKASSCQVQVHTYAKGIGQVYSDKYDMIRHFTYRMPGEDRGTYGTYVGTKSLLKGKWKILYNDKEKRDVMASKLRKLSFLCKKINIRKHYRKIQKESKEEVDWVGNLYNGDLHTGSKVNTSVENKIASLDGRQSFIERIKSLENAQESIYLQTMIFRGDRPGIYIANKLMEKKAQGLDVRVIVDALGSGPMSITQSEVDKINTPKMLSNLMAAGIRVFGFSCDGIKGFRGIVGGEISGVDITKLIRRHHEKMWIVDSNKISESSITIIGGINLAQEYFSLTGEHRRSWKDHDLGVKGPIIRDFKERFLSNWVEFSVNFKSYKKDKKCFNSFDPVTQKEEYQEFKKEHTLAYVQYEKEEDIEADKIIEENLIKFLDGEKHLENIFLNEDIRYREVDGLRVVHSDPEAGENYTHDAYVKMINRAQKSIHLANAYFNPPKDVVEALKNALKRGVKVKFYTNGEKFNAQPLFTYLGRSYFLPLYEAARDSGHEDNFEVYEWDGTRGDREDPMVGSTHVKYMIIDGLFGLNGSHNLSHSSMHNSEILLLFEGKEISRDMIDQFEFDLEYTEKITPEQMKEFKTPKRLKDRIRNFLFKSLAGKLA